MAPHRPRHCLIVGTGYTGRRLLARLSGAATGVGRSVHGPGSHRLDLDSQCAWPAAVAQRTGRDYSVVYTVPPGPDSDQDLRLQRLLERLPERPHAFVYLSTSGVYGDCHGARVDETTPARPQTSRAKRRVHAEQRLVRWAAGDVVLTVLRVPGIYGPGRLGLERLRQGQPLLLERDANPGNRIHVDDLVSCCIAALDDSVPAGIYNIGDGDARSSTWFAQELARQAGLGPPALLSRADAERQFSATRLSFLNESRRLDLAKMNALLCPDIQYPDATDGIKASLADEARER